MATEIHVGDPNVVSDGLEFAIFTAEGFDDRGTLADTNDDRAVTLADRAVEVLVVEGVAAFVSTAGRNVDVGVVPVSDPAKSHGDSVDAGRGVDSGATVSLGHLCFTSGDGATFETDTTRGNVTIREDDGMDLVGTNRAQTVVLTSGGALTDNVDNLSATNIPAVTEIYVGDGDPNNLIPALEFAIFTATGFDEGGTATEEDDRAITLADTALDVLQVEGVAVFVSTAGRNIDVGVTSVSDPTKSHNDSVDEGRGADSLAAVTFGHLCFTSGDGATFDADTTRGHVTIREDDAMDLVGINRVQSVVLTSSDVLTDNVDELTETNIPLATEIYVGDPNVVSGWSGVRHLYGRRV